MGDTVRLPYWSCQCGFAANLASNTACATDTKETPDATGQDQKAQAPPAAGGALRDQQGVSKTKAARLNPY